MVMVGKDVLRAIESRDPDGGSIEPTDAMYAAHESWAVRTYGRAAWQAYRVGGWDDNVSAMEDPGRTADYVDSDNDWYPVQVQGQLAMF